jgi:hypothetical protein
VWPGLVSDGFTLYGYNPHTLYDLQGVGGSRLIRLSLRAVAGTAEALEVGQVQAPLGSGSNWDDVVDVDSGCDASGCQTVEADVVVTFEGL